MQVKLHGDFFNQRYICVSVPIKILLKWQGKKMLGKIISIYGTRWCGDCRRTRKILDDNNINYIFIDIDLDKDGEKFVVATNHGNRSVPTIVFPDGSVLIEPGNYELIEKLKAMGEI